MKRIFSKKSGFTLVEIVVAFAVFAIMATTIMQIMSLVATQKSENAKFLAELEAQEEILAANGKKEYSAEDGQITLDFNGKTESFGYDMKAANGDDDLLDFGLAYFVSEEDEGGASGGIGGGGSTNSEAGSQGMMGTLDARITGSRNFDVIRIEDIKKEVDGSKVIYYIQLYAGASSAMTEEDCKYAQFRLNFFTDKTTDEGKEYTDDSGKKFTRKVPDRAYILDAGYVNCGSLSDSDLKSKCKSVVKEKNYSSGDSTNSPFCVAKTGDNTLRISSPYVNSGGSVKFNRQSFRIYVVFDKDNDPNLSTTSFGHNATSNGTYKSCPVYKETYNSDGTCKYEETGKYSNYIYGAYMYSINIK